MPHLLPRRINGYWALIHRPMTPLGAHVWISYSPDLRHWGSHKLMLEARRGAWWDANKIGMSPPPIETPRGWLMIYHGVRRTPSSSIYRLGLALFDSSTTGKMPDARRFLDVCAGSRLRASRRRAGRGVPVRLHHCGGWRHHQSLLRRCGFQHCAGTRKHSRAPELGSTRTAIRSTVTTAVTNNFIEASQCRRVVLSPATSTSTQNAKSPSALLHRAILSCAWYQLLIGSPLGFVARSTSSARR